MSRILKAGTRTVKPGSEEAKRLEKTHGVRPLKKRKKSAAASAKTEDSET